MVDGNSELNKEGFSIADFGQDIKSLIGEDNEKHASENSGSALSDPLQKVASTSGGPDHASRKVSFLFSDGKQPRSNSICSVRGSFLSDADYFPCGGSSRKVSFIVDDDAILEMSRFDFDKLHTSKALESLPSLSHLGDLAPASLQSTGSSDAIRDSSMKKFDSACEDSQVVGESSSPRNRSSSMLSTGSMVSALRGREFSLDSFADTDALSHVRSRELSIELSMLPSLTGSSGVGSSAFDVGGNLLFACDDDGLGKVDTKDIFTRSRRRRTLSTLEEALADIKGSSGSSSLLLEEGHQEKIDEANNAPKTLTTYSGKARMPTGKQVLVYLRMAADKSKDIGLAQKFVEDAQLKPKQSPSKTEALSNGDYSTLSSSQSQSPKKMFNGISHDDNDAVDQSSTSDITSNLKMKPSPTCPPPPPPKMFPTFSLMSIPTLEKNGKVRTIGGYTMEQRRNRILRFLRKRRNRVWMKQVKYGCRKKLADSRPRVKGRFVTQPKKLSPKEAIESDGLNEDTLKARSDVVASHLVGDHPSEISSKSHLQRPPESIHGAASCPTVNHDPRNGTENPNIAQVTRKIVRTSDGTTTTTTGSDGVIRRTVIKKGADLFCPSSTPLRPGTVSRTTYIRRPVNPDGTSAGIIRKTTIVRTATPLKRNSDSNVGTVQAKNPPPKRKRRGSEQKVSIKTEDCDIVSSGLKQNTQNRKGVLNQDTRKMRGLSSALVPASG